MESPPRIVVPPEATAAGPTPPPAPPRTPDDSGASGRLLPLFLLACIGLISVGAIGYAYLQRGASDTDLIDAGVSNEPTTTATTAPALTGVSPTTLPAASTTIAPTTTAPPSTESPAVLAGPPSRDTGTVRHAVLADGILYLRGKVPSADFGAEIARRAELVVGPGNVVNQYQVESSAPPVDSAPLYVADAVLFSAGDVGINPAFLPLLDLGTKLLSINENVVITVVAHTDSAGSASMNLRLSQQRAEVVRQYWIDQGADASRIVADGRGEADPIADNSTSQGKQLNRRAEFIVTGILG